MIKPSHAKVRRAVSPKVSDLARALRPHLEPLLDAGHSWDEIGRAIERHLKEGSPGAPAPTSAKRPTDKPASGSDGRSASMFTPRARAYVWRVADGAPIKTH
jgi:hypothetical protein